MAIIRPHLPSYSDDEVTCFHPVFEYAANNALAQISGGGDIKVVHHRPINGITVDFAFERISTGKIILLAEIKRTPSDTQSTRTRNQARSYFLEAKPHTETPYYLTSNLEVTDLFRNDDARPQVSSQLIEGSPLSAGNLTTTAENVFYDKLENNISELLTLALTGQGSYSERFSHLQSLLAGALHNPDKWHQLFIPVAFEYIRGAAKKTPKLASLIKSIGWKPADAYKGTPDRLINLGAKVDFAQIFKPPAPILDDSTVFDNQTITDAYEAGSIRVTGDDLAELVNELLAPTGLGIVETDDELARLLSIVSKDAFEGDELGENAVLCDPAAGSGKLLIAASQLFVGLKPSQYWANEINPLFAEPLSLRLGLSHAASLSPAECPRVTINDVANLTEEEFGKVKIILLNPPFISGVQDTALKNKMANRIQVISGKKSITNSGQIGLEAVFLELIWHLIPEGTVITAIMPHRYISGLSSEVVAFRRFLISQLQLSHIVSYPRNGLFEKVTKQTIIFAGVKSKKPDRHIKIIDVQVPLENVGYAQLSAGLKSGNLSPARGVEVQKCPASSMLSDVDSGWGAFVGNRAKTYKWSASLFVGYKQLESLGAGLRRGTSGNNGCSDLSIFTMTDSVGLLIGSLVPNSWLVPGINNSDAVPKFLNVSTAPELALVPPLLAYRGGTPDNLTLIKIITAYLGKVVKPSLGSQKKAVKSIDEVELALHRNQKSFQPCYVLIPRALRVEGKIGVTLVPMVVSTNFVMAKFDSEQEAKLVASWLFSVFGQIQMELNFSNQEGMRKLEKEQVGKILYPDISSIPLVTQNQLISAYIADAPLQFKSPKQRTIDSLWAQVVSPLNHADVLVTAFDLFCGLCEDRNP
jgi:hypothetical protein